MIKDGASGCQANLQATSTPALQFSYSAVETHSIINCAHNKGSHICYPIIVFLPHKSCAVLIFSKCSFISSKTTSKRLWLISNTLLLFLKGREEEHSRLSRASHRCGAEYQSCFRVRRGCDCTQAQQACHRNSRPTSSPITTAAQHGDRAEQRLKAESVRGGVSLLLMRLYED